MNNLLSNGNHMNDNNTSKPSSSLSAEAVVAIVYPWIWHILEQYLNGTTIINKSPSSPFLCAPVLGDWVGSCRITYDNSTSTPYSSLSAAAAVAVVYLWINPARVHRKKRMRSVI